MKAMTFLCGISILAALLTACAMDTGSDRTVAGGDSSLASADGNAVIHFARRGGILNWEVANESTVYIQDLHRQWYRADLMSPCIGLQFRQRIGFTFEPNGDLDKFSAIRNGREVCAITSLTRVGAPSSSPPRIPTAYRP